MTNLILEQALWYARLGIAVFPWTLRDGRKMPFVKGGHLSATTDAALITEWWAKWPEASIGVPSGSLVTLDIDKHHPRHDGSISVDVWKLNLSTGVQVRTPSGGLHCHYRAGDRDLPRLTGLQSLLPSVDWLGKNGWCAVPAPGSSYTYVNGLDLSGCQPLPEQLAALWRPTDKLERQFRKDCDAMAETAEGGRRTALNAVAFRWAHGVKEGKLDETLFHNVLTVAGLSSGLDGSEVEKTIADAWNDVARTSGPAGAAENKHEGFGLFTDAEPWPEEVDGEELLSEIEGCIKRYVVVGEARTAAVAYWVLTAHLMDIAVFAPRLLVTSPRKRSGKTTLFRLIGNLVPRPLAVENISLAPLFRLADVARPTILLDEADKQLGAAGPDLLGLINAGHHIGGQVVRCVGEGRDITVKVFKCFGAMALAGIGRKFTDGPLLDRCIEIVMERRLQSEPIEIMDGEDLEHLHRTHRRIVRFCADHAGDIRAMPKPVMPAFLNDRQRDNWRMQFRIAALIGPDALKRLTAAVTALINAADADADDDDLGLLLLSDMRDLRLTLYQEAEWTRTADILAQLQSLEERPWNDQYKPLTDQRLAYLLRGFYVRSSNRRSGRTVRKGYVWSEFSRAWERYLPPPVPPV